LFKFLPNWIDAIEKRIKQNENPHFIVGSKRTIADFAVDFKLLLNNANPHYQRPYSTFKTEKFLRHTPLLTEKISRNT
jgi:hypothetical protein